MVLPLKEVRRKEQLASKPGYIMDEYIRIQEINNAVDACKEEIAKNFIARLVKDNIFKTIDKWLLVNK